MQNQEETRHWVYMLRCADDSLYTGWTMDPKKRIQMHHTGRGSKYVRSRLPARMVYLELCDSKEVAMHREAAIKKLTKIQKEKLIFSDSNQGNENIIN